MVLISFTMLSLGYITTAYGLVRTVEAIESSGVSSNDYVSSSDSVCAISKEQAITLIYNYRVKIKKIEQNGEVKNVLVFLDRPLSKEELIKKIGNFPNSNGCKSMQGYNMLPIMSPIIIS